MVEQVRLSETYTVDDDILERTVFAFGTHATATAADEHAVTTAQAAPNKLRIIMDHLLLGNNLEEIQCRAMVDDDDFARVPVGATPDDIARCSVAQDVLPALCPGSNKLSVCICQLDAGCPGVKSDGTPFTTPKGQSVGVEDADQDGAADDTRFIKGAVGITCTGVGAPVDVPIDLDASYWTPSGDQLVPAMGGFDALGPAIVLVPAVSVAGGQGALPTNSVCGLSFAPDVVDKVGVKVCAPPNGDVAVSCAPGDLSAFKFTVEALRYIAIGVPATGQSLTADVEVQANTPLAVASLAGVTVTQAGVPLTINTDFTVAPGMTPDLIVIHWVNPLMPTTDYVITLPTTITDFFGQPAPQPFQVAFTTAAM